ncbi:MAG: MGMT family protein [Spirochaetota bacterium]
MKRERAPNFYRRVYAETKRIPRGKVTTYGTIARVLGSFRASRAVGYALMHTPMDENIPWQRVINARGTISIGGNADRPAVQKRLLVREGVHFDKSGTVDMKKYFWEP